MSFRKQPVAWLALFIALGGTSYAATQLPPGSVGTQQLRNGAVTNAKVKAHSLTHRAIAPGGALQFRYPSVTVPAPGCIGPADAPPQDGCPQGFVAAQAYCKPWEHVVGGYYLEGGVPVEGSPQGHPVGVPGIPTGDSRYHSQGWEADVYYSGQGGEPLTVYAICVS